MELGKLSNFMVCSFSWVSDIGSVPGTRERPGRMILCAAGLINDLKAAAVWSLATTFKINVCKKKDAANSDCCLKFQRYDGLIGRV